MCPSFGSASQPAPRSSDQVYALSRAKLLRAAEAAEADVALVAGDLNSPGFLRDAGGLLDARAETQEERGDRLERYAAWAQTLTGPCAQGEGETGGARAG